MSVEFLIDNIWLVLIALVSGGALLFPSLMRPKGTLSTLQATQLLNQGKVTILDVRTPEEFRGGHLRQSKNIPLDQLGERIGELDKGLPALVVCAAGPRAARAAAQLRRAGFGEVYVLGGGFGEWQAQGLPTAKA
jgi:rhodanese-related sulfurtransferase